MIASWGAVAWVALLLGAESAKPEQEARSIYDFKVQTIDGREQDLAEFKGDVLLIVNVASRCGYTKSHYAGMRELHEKYREKGFRILAFPANNFLGQEPGTNKTIEEFCRNEKKVEFDLFSKISVAGEDQAPLYRYLTNHPDKDIAGPITWNFNMFLVDRQGNVVARFNTRVSPTDERVTSAIEKALSQSRKS